MKDKENKLYDNEECCCHDENCTCDCCCADDVKEEKFEVRENLTDEEIEEIIEKEYKDKNQLTKDFIRKALKKHGNRFSYEKTELIRGDKRFKNPSNRTATVTCHVHNGDIEIGTHYFVSDLYNGCFECNHGHPKTKTQEQFEKELHEAHPHYRLLPGETYVNSNTPLNFHCDKHNIDFKAQPANVIYKYGTIKNSCPECAREHRYEVDKEARTIREESLKSAIKEKYGDTYDILRISMYMHVDDCVKIHCNICNTDSEMASDVAKERLEKDYKLCDCCREEEERLKREEEFRQKVYTRFPGRFNLDNLHYEYNNTRATGFICNTCGKEFSVGSPVHFLQQGAHCPCCNISGGETMIYNWVEDHKDILEFEWQYKIDNNIIVGRKDYYNVIIDFKLEYNNKTYFIEYNGEQHYTYSKHFHRSIEDFEGQLRRDQNIRDYCNNSENIILIEIPFTYYNNNKIGFILDEIVLNNKNPQDLIVSPPINYFRTKKDREEAKKNGKL